MNQIYVGIPTLGEPELEKDGEHTLLRNMLIGKNFHWQKAIEALLPGEVTLTGDPEFPVLNRLPLETYLECVVGSEMNPDAPAEFLKAHAVISRGWALGKITGEHTRHTRDAHRLNAISETDRGAPYETMASLKGHGKINTPDRIVNWEDTCDHHGFQVCSDDHCQRYQGIQPIPPEILDAIRSTAGLVLRAPDGGLVDTRFSKCCGGHTELFSTCWQDTDPPCLESFADPWCDLSTLSETDRRKVLTSILKDYDLENGGGYRWHAEATPEEIKRNLKEKFGREIGEILDLKVTERGPSGRARRLAVIGSAATIEIGKELMIRRLLSPTHLYSSAFTIKRRTNGNSFLLDGSGWGHGVGLCQIGAARMASEGRDFQSILAFYYPGSILTN